MSYATCRSVPSSSPAPLLYVHSASLTKPHAVEHLADDLHSYNVDVAVITKSHLKLKHTDRVVAVLVTCYYGEIENDVEVAG